MPDTKISADSAATTTAGAEVAGIQGGGNVRIPAGLLQQSVRTGTVTQAGHGFVAGDVLKLSGTTWSKAIATSVANATAIAVVESATTDTLVPVLAGRITLSGLTAGIYYLSDATAGLLTLTAPTTSSSYLVPILRAVSATDAYVDIGSPLSLSLIQEADLAFAIGEATVASATTTDLGAATSQHIYVTGSTTITGFGTAPAGRRRYLRFAGALALTNNATSLILPSGANITTVANDRLCALSLGSGNWLVYWYQRADGTALVGGGGGSGDVTASSSFGTDNRIIRSDGTGKGVQSSGAEVDDSGNVNVLGDGVQGSVTLADAHATSPKSISITVPASITNPYRLVLPGVLPAVGQSLRVASIAGEVVTLEHATPAGGSVATDTIWDAAGDLAVGTGSDTAGRLARPTQYLYNALLPDFDGALRWWHVPVSNAVGNFNSTVQLDGWQCAVNGTGSSAIAPFPSDSITSGLIRPVNIIETGTTTTGGAKLYWRSHINAYENRGVFRLSEWAYVELETAVSISAVSDGTNTFKFRFGLIPSTTNASTEATFGMFIEFDTHARVVGRVSSSNTATSDTAYTAATAYNLKLRLDVAGGSIQGWLNGSSLGTVSSGLPNLSTNAGVSAAAWILKSAGTTNRTVTVSPIVWKLR